MQNFDLENIDCHATLLMTKNTQSGRSMIEMLGVLAIIGVLSVGGIVGYSKAMTKYRINKTIEQITLIAGNIRTFFGQQQNYLEIYCGGSCNSDGCQAYSGIGNNGNPTYSFNGCPIIKKAKILPDEMIMVTDGKIMSITNPFGGWVNLEVVDKAKSGDSQAFYILYTIGDNMEACIELLSHDWSNANAQFILVSSGPGNNYYLKTPVAVDKAIDICDKKIRDAKQYNQIIKGLPYISFYFDVNLNGDVWKNTDWAN